jgi:hypothetical protein
MSNKSCWLISSQTIYFFKNIYSKIRKTENLSKSVYVRRCIAVKYKYYKSYKSHLYNIEQMKYNRFLEKLEFYILFFLPLLGEICQ